jgi:hypothetical protein
MLFATTLKVNSKIVAQLKVSPTRAVAWRRRFVDEGVGSMGRIRSGRGRKLIISTETIDEIVRLT